LTLDLSRDASKGLAITRSVKRAAPSGSHLPLGTAPRDDPPPFACAPLEPHKQPRFPRTDAAASNTAVSASSLFGREHASGGSAPLACAAVGLCSGVYVTRSLDDAPAVCALLRFSDARISRAASRVRGRRLLAALVQLCAHSVHHLFPGHLLAGQALRQIQGGAQDVRGARTRGHRRPTNARARWRHRRLLPGV